ncbi:NAD-dependent epimerase/dehydratase family protein [Candidatus Fermentibacteria bacterium]|nr:NAD-dependent epimerase/dehydratase family protein [Candidatus Fermentibacteria bacterium]
MRVLVTGGAGFIGSHIQDALLDAGHEVVVVDDLSTGHRENVSERARFYQLDIRDERLREVFSSHEPEAVFHLAAQMDVRRSVREPIYDAQANILGSIHLLEMCRMHGARRIVYASTGGAIYGEPEHLPADENHPINPISQYGISKHTVEHYLRLYWQNHGVSYLALRFPNVYGPRQDPHGEAGVVAIFSLQMLTGIQPVIFGDGSKTRDYVFIKDIVRANLIGLDGTVVGVYNLGWGTEVTDFTIFDTVRAAVGSNVEPRYAPRRLGEVERICLDARRAKQDLGWTPEIALDTGIARAVEYYRANPHGFHV